MNMEKTRLELAHKRWHSEVYDTLYNYYARNFPSWPREKIEKILKEKCGVEKLS